MIEGYNAEHSNNSIEKKSKRTLENPEQKIVIKSLDVNISYSAYRESTKILISLFSNKVELLQKKVEQDK